MTLDPLASQADVAAALGRDLTASELTRVDSLLAAASALVRGRSVTGQEFTRSTSTVRRRIIGGGPEDAYGHIVLPQRPVNDVTAVAHIDGEAVTRYRWDGLTTVYLYLYNPQQDFALPWRPGFDVVDVTYDHGYDEIPDDVVAVVTQMCARSLAVAPDEAMLTQERIEGYEYRRAPEAVAGIVSLLDDERRALRAYGAGTRASTVRLG